MRPTDAPDLQRVELQLPYPPSVNQFYKVLAVRGRGMMAITGAGKAYKKHAIELVAEQRAMVMLSGRLRVRVTAYMPDRRRRDIDNVVKPLLDTLTEAAVWGDDSQIDDFRITRGPVHRGGALVITIEETAHDPGAGQRDLFPAPELTQGGRWTAPRARDGRGARRRRGARARPRAQEARGEEEARPAKAVFVEDDEVPF